MDREKVMGSATCGKLHDDCLLGHCFTGGTSCHLLTAQFRQWGCCVAPTLAVAAPSVTCEEDLTRTCDVCRGFMADAQASFTDDQGTTLSCADHRAHVLLSGLVPRRLDAAGRSSCQALQLAAAEAGCCTSVPSCDPCRGHAPLNRTYGELSCVAMYTEKLFKRKELDVPCSQAQAFAGSLGCCDVP